MTETILFVDDDIHLVSALQRTLYKTYRVALALSAADALAAISESPYAVVVSDLQMPGMNGIELLTRVKELAPETVRILLTGQADLDAAIHAVNDGNIFRFLQKPCPHELLKKTLEAGLAQFRLQMAERDVLQQTLVGTVAVLTEILGAIEPAAFGRASRLRWCVRKLALELKVQDPWQFEAAAMLSQIGCISVAPEALKKYFTGDPLADDDSGEQPSPARVARQLLERVPRLHTVAQIIDRQQEVVEMRPDLAPEQYTIALGASMLRIALDFDELVGTGLSFSSALAEMKRTQSAYDARVFAALEHLVRDAAQVDAADPSPALPLGDSLYQPVSGQASP
ncbi:MAG: response regulator [Acidobacteriia bacterium]|nr:response regulator [Terriglobia bacterium]